MTICATGPTTLVTVGIPIWLIMCTLLSLLFGLSPFQLLLKLFYFLGQINHLAGISTAPFPGLLCGIEGFGRLVLLLTIFIKSVTLDGVVCGKRPPISLVPLAILGRVPFLGGWSVRTASISALPRHIPPSFGGFASLGLIGSSFLIVFISKDLVNVL